MEEKIAQLQIEIEEAKRKTRVIEIYKAADPNIMSTKAMVLKLSGFAKFEVDHKFQSEHFYRMVIKLSTQQVGEESAFSSELFEKHCAIFKRSFNENQEQFKGNLEDETYKNILAYFRAFNPSATD